MDDLKKAEFLAAFPSLGDDQTAAADIMAVSHIQPFPAAYQVYSEGDSCGAIAFLLSGEIRVYKTGENGREITLYEIGSGETCILNASCILSGKFYPANAVSLSAGEALMVPSEDFRRLIDKYTSIREMLFRILAERLSGVMALIDEVAFARMDDRLMDYIIEKSEDGALSATHQKIAFDLGTSREVVSRILKDFERRGVLSLARNSITLLKTDNI